MTDSIKRHTWQEQDDTELVEAVRLITEAGRELRPRLKLWTAVAGRLLPRLRVTADAARSRWEKLDRTRRENEKPGETESDRRWREVAEQVETSEQDWQDYLLEQLRGLRDQQAVLAARMTSIADEQIRLRKLWE